MYPAPACRFGRLDLSNFRRFFRGTCFSLLTLLILLRMLSFLAAYHGLRENVTNIPARLFAALHVDHLKVLKSAMPVLAYSSFEGDCAGQTPGQIIYKLIWFAGRVNLDNPAMILRSQVPFLSLVEFPGVVAVSTDYSTSGDTTGKNTSPFPTGESMVAIYNTHTGETYSLTDGVERLDGRCGGVVTVAAALQETLENKYGMKAARSDRVNDANYNTAYLESEKTARGLLAANPKVGAILDIHRDSGKTREQSVIKINGQEAATILFVVGSESRRPFPTWRQNHAFAVSLSDKLNEMHPGLSQGVRVKEGLYNQNLHPHAVLVEVGTTKNSVEEAARAARYLADALAAVMAVKK